MRFVWALFVATLTVGAAVFPAVTIAASTSEIKQQIVELKLSPPMLFSSRLPSRIEDSTVSLSTDFGIAVTWDRGPVPGSRNRVGYISLQRGARSQLASDLRTWRLRGYRPRKVKLRGRSVWRLCGHVCGYAWIESGRSYGVYGIYYVGDEDGQTADRDQRALIRALRPLTA